MLSGRYGRNRNIGCESIHKSTVCYIVKGAISGPGHGMDLDLRGDPPKSVAEKLYSTLKLWKRWGESVEKGEKCVFFGVKWGTFCL